MKKLVVYIHGKGGSIDEAEHYKSLFPECDVIGLDYKSQTPWEAKEEFPELIRSICNDYEAVLLVANSIGAFFAMNYFQSMKIERAFLISPVVDMEQLIMNMMMWANVTEEDLKEKKVIETAFGETLYWDYLCYVRNNPIVWDIPTDILFGEKDNFTSINTITDFAKKHNATLTVMEQGEHWFHTEEQMDFLDHWIKKNFKHLIKES